MKKYKGFTLIELLGAIVILSVIALIGTPIISGIIENVKIEAFKRSCEGALKAYEYLRATETVSMVEVTDERLHLMHNTFKSGTIMTVNDSEIQVSYLYDGTYCGSGKIGNITVTKGECNGSALGDYVLGAYSITIDPNGGALKGLTTIQQMNVIIDEEWSLDAPIKQGYTFIKWKSVTTARDEDGKASINTKFTEDWEANQYKLTIDPDGGLYNNSTELVVENLYVGDKYTLSIPTKQNYKFAGWILVAGTGSETQISEYNENEQELIMGVENTTIKATYVLDSFNLVINPNGGLYEGKTGNTIYEIAYKETKEISTPTRAGYDFAGWEVSGEESKIENNIFTMGKGGASLKATWSAKSYTITYNCNGGSGSTSSSSHTYGVAKNLSSNGCYKITEGTSGMLYSFAGWSTNSSASTATYADGQSVSGVGSGANVTLYAIWKNYFSYTGSYNVISDGSGNWRIKLLSSGTLNINYATTIDLFLVGGGGGGSERLAGAGGGYTRTIKSILTEANSSKEIVVGKGGSYQSAGSESSAWGYKAAGGGGGGGTGNGANGGSGGGARGPDNDYGPDGGSGGTNGANGTSAQDGSYSGGCGQIKCAGPNGETGITREFGETTGDLYAAGGGGGAAKNNRWGKNGTVTTQANSGAAGRGYDSGQDGIVIIRNHR